MKKSVVFIILCLMLVISKYVVSGGFYDYALQQKELKKTQEQLIDSNKRAIAALENYRSTNYLFSQKEALGLSELSPERTIILREVSSDEQNK